MGNFPASSSGVTIARIEPPGPFGTIHYSELFRYREVLRMLAVRDLKLRYRQTLLGVIWVILQPVAAGLIFAVVFGRFAKMPSEGVDYLPFVLTGLVVWQLTSGIVLRSTNSLVAESRLITKVYFPRILIVLATVLAVLVDFIVSLIVLMAVLLAWRLPSLLGVMQLLLAGLLGTLLGTGVALITCSLNVTYRDVGHAIPFVVQVWMYVTPVVYGLSIFPPEWQLIASLNPMTAVIELARAGALGLDIRFAAVWPGLLISAFILLVGLITFARADRKMADIL